MLKKFYLFALSLFCAVPLFAQSPYGLILFRNNNNTLGWGDIGTVISNYLTYHPGSSFPAWLTQGNLLNPGDRLGSTNSEPLIFITNNTERMRITPSGNVGIGTTNPNELLDVNGNISFTGAL
ncbi:MAG: hypothetical protein ACPLPX_06755, partial [Candidatus Kapaibacteriota bacterium]